MQVQDLSGAPLDYWVAVAVPSAGERCTFNQSGPTLLVAAMRTRVAAAFGDDVPDLDLTKAP
ncbi:hypothetical protein DIE19_03530 [Burkholderia sp. Bp9126]|nr:hypothetical protein DIE19_03530 [Burkholderia sp. Bp9126]